MFWMSVICVGGFSLCLQLRICAGESFFLSLPQIMKRPFYLQIAAAVMATTTLLTAVGCSSGDGKSPDSVDSANVSRSEPVAVTTTKAPANVVEIPQGPRHHDRIHVNNIGKLWEVFNDSNKYQYVHAERLGVNPMFSLRDAYFAKRPLVYIQTCDDYFVDSLTHSMPYLVPEGARLLSDIGRNFIDSLANRGGDGYRIKVTSLLRTPMHVKRLRRVNVNSTDSSTHQFGTTFDISWSNFACSDPTRTLNEGDLKNLLAEVLNDLRNDGRCLVKFERKTCCFHVTAIK